ncbi:MAG: UDP-3-O-acyl-N-acetylglucosamine deacetylase [Victivallales bacterium]|nr:UDP-3-O-acyl-N-acetylglucosamine deacetylase [Victivallales bacterium]
MRIGRQLAHVPDEKTLEQSIASWEAMPVDQRFPAPADWRPPRFETTLAHPFEVTGPGTYTKGHPRTLRFLPGENGWQLARTDLPEQLPIDVDVRNVWTASRSIVLRSGRESNFVRMSEHIIAHRLGLGLDNVTIELTSGDPPLFNVGSLPIAEGILNAGMAENPHRPLRYFTVREPVTLAGPNGSFLHLEPANPGDFLLHLDVGIDFPSAIGRQRIQFDLWKEAFMRGAHARTNCPRSEVIFAMTIGKLFADIRNLGYTRENILIAGRKEYMNEPALVFDGKSLEAVWHRACLDLVAALSLFRRGRLAGSVVSYKAGHNLDCRLMTLLEKQGLWQALSPLP